MRFALRTLRRSPVFASVSIAVLALAIGANSAVFSFIDALLVRSLPVAEPERLVSLGPGLTSSFGMSDSPQDDSFSYEQLEALREFDGVFSSISATPTFGSRVTVGERTSSTRPARAQCDLVDGEYFRMLGIQPLAGRWIEPEDDQISSGGARVVVLSHGYWTRRFGGDLGALGQTILLQDEPFTVIGVAPQSFTGHVPERPVDVWVPLAAQPGITRRESLFVGRNRQMSYWLNVFGRLAPGVSAPQAEEAVNQVVLRVHETYGDGEISEDFRVQVLPVGRGISSLRDRLARPLNLLWAGTGLLLLIACANLANLLLARAAERRREIGVRIAIGAGAARLLRQLVAESLILAAAGVALGLAVADGLMPVMHQMVGELRGSSELATALDGRVVTFAAAVGLATLLLFGAAPAWWALRSGLASALAGGRGAVSVSRGQTRAKNLLIASQVALSLVLLSATGLIMRTLGELKAVDLGVEPENVWALNVSPRASGVSAEGQDEMRRAILAEVAPIREIQSVAFADGAPFTGNHSSSTLRIEGYEPAEQEDMNVIVSQATPAYFDVLDVPLVEGRLFRNDDQADQTGLVNEAFAARFFPNRSAVGGVIIHRDERLQIVGVVGGVRQVDVREAAPPILYRTSHGSPAFQDTLLFRTRGDVPPPTAAMRQAIERIAPQMPVSRTPTPISQILDRAAALERLLGKLTGAFAALALLLASLGIYGVLSHGVARRTGELGLRQALGADARELTAMVLRQASAVLAGGAAVGLVGSWFAGKLLAGVLFGVAPADPWALGAALAALMTAGLAAAYLPSRRAARVSPAEALRHE